jgi:hypothetical protein
LKSGRYGLALSIYQQAMMVPVLPQGPRTFHRASITGIAGEVKALAMSRTAKA